MKKFVFLFLLTISLLTISNINASEFSIHSKNALLYNVEENTIMYQKNPDERAQIASLTKVLTTLTILDKKPDLNKKIKMSTNVDYDFLKKKDLALSSLDKDKEYTYRDLLYSFIMESAADCGYALAIDSSGSTEKFVSDMNVEKEKLGMDNSHFSNPVGLDDKDNYSTMTDVLILMKAALKNDELKSMMSTFTYRAEDNTKLVHSLAPYVNKNTKNKIAKGLYMDYLKGGKTGTENIPGHALMSYANKNGSTYIFVTTNAKDDVTYPEHVEDAKTVYSYYFNTYGYKKLVRKDFVLDSLKTKYAKENKVVLKSPEDINYFTDKTFDESKVVLKYNGVRTVTPKYKKGDKLGNCYVYYDNNLIKTIPVSMPITLHMSFTDFIQFNKYLIIAIICYLFIIIATIIIVRNIKKKKA